MGALANLQMYGRFVTGLPRYLRRQISLEDAQSAIREGLANRERNFLRIAERGIFGNPRSPYLPLLQNAGCEFGDLQTAVNARGLEPTLAELRSNGVYFTFEEYKGRAPVVRSGRTLAVEEHDFDNPLTASAYESTTGGSTSGIGTRVETDLVNLHAQVPHLMMGRWAHDLLGVPMAVWYGSFPDPTGVGIYLRAAAYRGQPDRWFTPITAAHFNPALKDRLATEYVLLISRLAGVPCPRPEPLPLHQASRLAQWASEAVARAGACEIVCTVSLALRVCLAAEEEGIDIRGSSFFGGGEPYTAAKRAVLERVGSRYVSIYIAEDTGPMGLACPASPEAGDQHLLEDNIALIQHPREVANAGVEVNAFYLTSLRPAASKILLNVESDDYGVVDSQPCGCPLEKLGYGRHIRKIRSFGKLTGEGVTLVGSEMVRILEEVLPQRFGGSPQDFQLLEEDDQNGIARLSLLVHPSLDLPAEAEVIQTVLQALGESSVAASLARVFWEQAETFRVVRREPIWTTRGKLLPIRVATLHVDPSPDPPPSSPESLSGDTGSSP